MSRAAAKQKALRDRRKRGEVVLPTVVDEVALAELLIASGHLTEAARDDRAALARGLARWLAERMRS
jgi:hypothetical protein